MFTTQSSAYTFRQLVATGPNVAAGSSLDHTADRSLCNAGADCFQSLSVAQWYAQALHATFAGTTRRYSARFRDSVAGDLQQLQPRGVAMCTSYLRATVTAFVRVANVVVCGYDACPLSANEQVYGGGHRICSSSLVPAGRVQPLHAEYAIRIYRDCELRNDHTKVMFAHSSTNVHTWHDSAPFGCTFSIFPAEDKEWPMAAEADVEAEAAEGAAEGGLLTVLNKLITRCSSSGL
jgi:hypothetical protein